MVWENMNIFYKVYLASSSGKFRKRLFAEGPLDHDSYQITNVYLSGDRWRCSVILHSKLMQ